MTDLRKAAQAVVEEWTTSYILDPGFQDSLIDLEAAVLTAPEWSELVREFRTAAGEYWMVHPTDTQKIRFHAAYGALFKALEKHDQR